VLTEGELASWKVSENSRFRRSIVLLVSPAITLTHELWYVLCIPKPFEVALGLEDNNGSMALLIELRGGESVKTGHLIWKGTLWTRHVMGS
jgi:hypothetical protein